MTKIIPHFHGVCFSSAEIDHPSDIEFFKRLKDKSEGYYSEMALRNAVLNFGEVIPRWKQKIMAQYYTRDIGETFSVIGNVFYEYQQQYVNTYKQGSQRHEDIIQKRISEHPVLRDLWFLTPESAVATDTEKDKYNNGRTDAFVAMSKFPRHAVKFASVSIDEKYNKQGSNIHFTGMVLVSFESPETYRQCAHYDVLANKRAKLIAVNGHYKYQTEVDFLGTNPEMVFPIVIPEQNAVWDDVIKNQYGLEKLEFENLKTQLSKRTSPKGANEEIMRWYSNHIVSKLKAQPDVDLVFIKADGHDCPYTDDVKKMQSEVISSVSSLAANVDRTFQHLNRTDSQYKREAKLNKKEADFALRGILSSFKAEQAALKALHLEESSGLESYETISMDRTIAIENPKLSREDRDLILAEKLGKTEVKRGDYFASMVTTYEKIRER